MKVSGVTSQNELASMGIVPTMTEEEAQAGAEGASPVVDEGGDAAEQTQTAEANATEASFDETKPKKPQRAIDRIPTDDAGNRIYEQAKVEDTAAALIEQMGGNVDEAIDNAKIM